MIKKFGIRTKYLSIEHGGNLGLKERGNILNVSKANSTHVD